jgi:hypothetical protein
MAGEAAGVPETGEARATRGSFSFVGSPRRYRAVAMGIRRLEQHPTRRNRIATHWSDKDALESIL